MAAGDLTTTAAVRSFLQKRNDDTDQDAIIADLITRASTAISRYCTREFAPKVDASTARTFEYAGSGLLSLAPYDARTVTQVRIDTDEASPTTLTSSDYRLAPYPARDGVYTHLRLSPFVLVSTSRFVSRLVEVTGTWGFASVPVDVEEACIVTAAEWTRRLVAGRAAFPADEGGDGPRQEAIPFEARMLLKPYMRAGYA